VRELHELRDVLLDAGLGVVAKLDPTLGALCSDVVLDGTADLALSEEGAVHEFIQEGLL
jgi:hypothetical protein